MKTKILYILLLLSLPIIGYSQTNPLPGFGSTTGVINKLEVFAGTNMDRFLRFRNGGNLPIGFAGIQFSSYDEHTWFTYPGTVGELIFSQATGNPTVKGSLGTALFVLTKEGNVGIGTTVPSNDQQFGRVMELKSSHHAKFLVSSENNAVKVGMFSHFDWLGTGPKGIIGTESNHDLAFHTNLSQEQIRIKTNGNVGIGTSNPTNKLEVNGTIKTKEVNVTITGWPDYVFAPEYNLISLDSLSEFIQVNRHLPDVPTEKSVVENGVNIGEMNAILLKKIEELTLYLLKQEGDLKLLKNSNESIKEELSKLSAISKNKK